MCNVVETHQDKNAKLTIVIIGSRAFISISFCFSISINLIRVWKSLPNLINEKEDTCKFVFLNCGLNVKLFPKIYLKEIDFFGK